MRILVANEPRSYREAFTRVFQALRPHVESIAVDPDALDREALRLRPDLVVCGRVTPMVETVARCWSSASRGRCWSPPASQACRPVAGRWISPISSRLSTGARRRAVGGASYGGWPWHGKRRRHRSLLGARSRLRPASPARSRPREARRYFRRYLARRAPGGFHRSGRPSPPGARLSPKGYAPRPRSPRLRRRSP